MLRPVSAIAWLASAMLLAGCPFAMDDDYYTVSESPQPDAAPSESAALPDAGLKSAAVEAGATSGSVDGGGPAPRPSEAGSPAPRPPEAGARPDAGCKGKECPKG